MNPGSSNIKEVVVLVAKKYKKKVETKEYKYEDRPLTTIMSKAIYRKWKRYPFVLADLDTGAGKTYIGINAVGQFDPHAVLFVVTLAKQRDMKHFERSVAAYNKAKNADIIPIVYNFESLYVRDTDAWGNAITQADLRPEIQQAIDDAKNTPIEGQTRKRNMYLIIDEVHRIKNPTAVSSKTITKKLMPQTIRAVGLTATPIGNHADDLMNYFILNGLIRNKTQFINRYACHVNNYHQMITAYKRDKNTGRKVINWEKTFNDPIVKKYYYDFTVSYNTVHLLPPAVRMSLPFCLTTEETEQYEETVMNQEMFDSNAEFRSELNSQLGLSKNRLLTLKREVLENDKLPKSPKIIFYTYTATKDFILPKLQKLGYQVFVVNGGMKKKERDAISKLRDVNDPKTIVLAQYRAGGTGLDLPNFQISVMYEYTYSSIDFKQALGRNRRAYQKKKVYQVRLISYLHLHPKKVPTLEAQAYRDILDRSMEANSQLKDDLTKKTVELVKQIKAEEASQKKA